MKAETMFKEYGNMKREASILQFQLSRFEGIGADDVILAMQFSHPEGEERVQTGTVPDKTASAAVSYRQVMERMNDEWFDYLFLRYRYVKEELDFFDLCLSQLPKVQSAVMKDLLNGEMTWEDIAIRHHVSTTMVSKYKKAALKEMNARYELRDSRMEAYLLS